MITSASNYNYNNAINDGITYCDEYLIVYNENCCLYVCYRNGYGTLELQYDGYFITRYDSKLIFADKKKGFALCAYDLETEKEYVLWNIDVRWIICVKDICFFTKKHIQNLKKYKNMEFLEDDINDTEETS